MTKECNELQNIYDYKVNEKERIIYLVGDIEKECLMTFMTAFHYLEGLGDAPMTIVISSDGGDVEQAWGMADLVMTSKCHVTTMGIGAVGSAATIVFLAGRKRIFLENSLMFVHNYHIDVGYVDTNLLKKAHKENQHAFERYLDFVIKKSFLSKRRFKTFCTKETWFDSETCLKYGLIDEIVQSELKNVKRSKTKAK